VSQGKNRQYEKSCCKIDGGYTPREGVTPVSKKEYELAREIEEELTQEELVGLKMPYSNTSLDEIKKRVSSELFDYEPATYKYVPFEVRMAKYDKSKKSTTSTTNDANAEFFNSEEIRERVKKSVMDEVRADAKAYAEKKEARGALVEAAYSKPDGNKVIEDGPWEGFTYGDAMAWSIAILDHATPEGMHHPGFRGGHYASLAKVNKGELPDYTALPHIAKIYLKMGITVQEFRLVLSTLNIQNNIKDHASNAINIYLRLRPILQELTKIISEKNS